MSTNASTPSAAESNTLADLIADSVVVQQLLHVDQRAATAIRLPEQGTLRIPEPALALVAGLDSYGD